MDLLDDVLTRGVANIISGKEELRKLLQSGKKLNVYLGIDPTATQIHLGNAVPLRKLQLLAELGHNVTFLIGSFTALIGDTSDKETERPTLTTEEIEKNFQTYKQQAEKLLDFSKVTVRYNSEWLSKLTFADIVRLTQHFAVGDFTGRELIRKRLSENKRVGLHEVLYPVMQGYDSYFMDTDIQLGGTDQTFNMQAGRILQKDLRKKDSYIIANEFLSGTDGRKMSKTWGNAIWLTDKPVDMYTKAMAIKDTLIVEYFTLGTNLPLVEILDIAKSLKSSDNPLSIKKRLAFQIVKELHSEKDATVAQKEFESVVQKKERPSAVEQIKLDIGQIRDASISDVLVNAGVVNSKSEAKRVVTQGGITINDEKVTDPNAAFEEHFKNGKAMIQRGKFRFVKITTT